MAKKKVENNTTNNNQLVYYILFFVLGALFAAGILAVNDGVSGRVTYELEGEFDPARVAEKYIELLSITTGNNNLLDTAVLANDKVQETITELEGSPINQQLYSQLAGRHLQEIVAALSFAEEFKALAEAENVNVEKRQGEWEITSATIQGQTLKVQQRNIEEYYQGPNPKAILIHETITPTKGKPVAIELLPPEESLSTDGEAHSLSTDGEAHSLSTDGEAHSLSTDGEAHLL